MLAALLHHHSVQTPRAPTVDTKLSQHCRGLALSWSRRWERIGEGPSGDPLLVCCILRMGPSCSELPLAETPCCIACLLTSEKRCENRTVDRYRSPALGRTVTISLPAFSGLSATLHAIGCHESKPCRIKVGNFHAQCKLQPQHDHLLMCQLLIKCAGPDQEKGSSYQRRPHLRAAATAAPEEMPHMRPSCMASCRA